MAIAASRDADVCKGEVIGDDAAPSVGAKFNWESCHARSILRKDTRITNGRGRFTPDQSLPCDTSCFTTLPTSCEWLARGDEQRIAGIDHDQVFHAHERDKLLRAVDVIAMRVDGEGIRGFGDVCCRRIGVAGAS